MSVIKGSDLNWELIKSFLAVVETGSLSKAASQLSLSQPTLTRHIQELEGITHLNLFQRSNQGLQLTDTGTRLLNDAKKMQAAAQKLALSITGQEYSLAGDIRVSVNEVVGIYLLPPAVTEFRKHHPEVQIELVITNQVSSLSRRDADMALRMFDPTQPDLVAKKISDLSLGFYAHQSYIDEHGFPESPEDFFSHVTIGFDRDRTFIEEAGRMGWSLDVHDFDIRTDSLLAGLALMRSGAGILATHCGLAEKFPDIVPVLQAIPLPSMPLWLVCHQDVQTNIRFRTFMNFLSDWFKEDPYKHTML